MNQDEYPRVLPDSKGRSIVQDITGNVTPTMSNMASPRPVHNHPRAPPSYNTATRMFPVEPTTETYDYELNLAQKNRKVLDSELLKYQMDRDEVRNEIGRLESRCEKSGNTLRKQQHLSGQLKEIDQKVNDIKTYLRDMRNPHS